jgi:phenylacetate-coenzyme A ligase PaaK-like adenylate-forming protein
MERLTSPNFNKFWWDTAEANERRKAILQDQVIPAVLFAQKYVPFYKHHYRKLGDQDINGIKSLDEYFAIVPYISKEHLSTNPPEAFMPETGSVELEVDPHWGSHFRFGTGGSTGKPVPIIHSISDWRAFSLTANRHIEFDFYEDRKISEKFSGFKKGSVVFDGVDSRLTPLQGARILGAYNADHITNAIYRTMLLRFGCEFFGRPAAASDLGSIYDATQIHKINGILAPPGGGNEKKGAFLESILKLDAKNSNPNSWDLSYRFNPEFKFVFWSSMPISRFLLNYLSNDLQIPYVKGHFGSTEVCPTASTCSHHMLDFHLVYAHSLVFIADLEKKELLGPNQLGYTVVSKIGGADKNGDNVLPSGMFLLNYVTGDGARLTEDGRLCQCGRNTPILYDIRRLDFHIGKARHGCQVD